MARLDETLSSSEEPRRMAITSPAGAGPELLATATVVFQRLVAMSRYKLLGMEQESSQGRTRRHVQYLPEQTFVGEEVIRPIWVPCTALTAVVSEGMRQVVHD